MPEQSESSVEQEIVDPLEQELENEPAPQPAPAPTPSNKKTFNLKVNGKDYQEEVDLSDDARIIKALQLERAAQGAFQRASEREKELEMMNNQLEQFFQMMKENPLAILTNPELGLNAEDIATKILNSKIEEEMKSPEQKELEEARAKLKKFEEDQQKNKNEVEKARMEKFQAEVEKEISDSISGAIEKGELPQSPYIIAKFGQLMEVALSRGVDISAEELIPVVKSAYIRDMKDMLGKLPDQVVEDLISSDRVKNIRKTQLSKIKQASAKTPSLNVPDTAPVGKTKEEVKKKSNNFWAKTGVW